MIKVDVHNSKFIRDPLFSSIKLWMQDRIQYLEANNRPEDLALARERYTGLTNDDCQIEKTVTYPNGVTLVSFLSRKTGFFHADANIKKVNFDTIVADLIPTMPQYTKAKLEELITDKEVNFGSFYLTDTKEYVLVINSQKQTVDDACNALGAIKWDKMTLDLIPKTTPIVQRSGTFAVETVNMTASKNIPVYYVPGVT